MARGLAGPRMRAAGVQPVAQSEDATAIGLWEVLGALPRLAALLGRLKRDLQAHPKALVVTVDSPDLMLRFGRFAKRRGHRVVHWVAPQVWAWRPGRVHRLARACDTVLCLLPFEPPLLEPYVRAVFTGHPAAVGGGRGGVRPGTPTFALLPGSRPSEVRRTWPVLREVARELRQRHPMAGFLVPRAPSIARAALGGLDAIIVDDVSDIADADAAVVTSGTATLQVAALGVPMVVIYKVHPFTWAIARRLVRVPHLALPNLLSATPLVPEILQDLDPGRIADAVDAVRGQAQVPRSILASLDGSAAIERAADEVAPLLFS